MIYDVFWCNSLEEAKHSQGSYVASSRWRPASDDSAMLKSLIKGLECGMIVTIVNVSE